jgi:hypothetical protein
MHMTGGDLPGLKRLRERMKDCNKGVLVGVPEGAKAKQRVKKAGSPDRIVESGTALAMVAAVHEFGSPEQGIPERSFLRSGIREGVPKFNRLNEANLRAVVLGSKTADQSLDMLGVVATGEVKRKIRQGPFEPLKQSTIDRKGSSKPLIDTAQLIQGITYVREGEQSANARVIE